MPRPSAAVTLLPVIVFHFIIQFLIQYIIQNVYILCTNIYNSQQLRLDRINKTKNIIYVRGRLNTNAKISLLSCKNKYRKNVVLLLICAEWWVQVHLSISYFRARWIGSFLCYFGFYFFETTKTLKRSVGRNLLPSI